MSGFKKRRLKKALLHLPGFRASISFLTREIPRIFLYHRFAAVPQQNQGAVDVESFRWQLRQLSRKWQVVSFAKYLQFRKEGKIPPYLVVLTIDDGYRDFYDIAYPELKRHNMPATFFITTDFIDGKIWLWPDRIRYTLENSTMANVDFPIGSSTIIIRTETKKSRGEAWDLLVDYCIHVDDQEKWRTIARLESLLQVTLPQKTPEAYRAASWDQLREMADNGIEIGAHTITHPILSRISRDRVDEEVSGSRRIIEEKLGREVVSFCYPNSRPADIKPGVVEAVEKAGYKGAVHEFGPDFSDLFRIPRLGVFNDKVDFLWKLCGMETCMMLWKRS